MILSFLKKYAPLLLLAHFSVFAQIDSTSVHLQEVTISKFHVSDSLLNAPAAIGTISAADLKRNNNTEIATSLNRISGVLMQSGSLNTNRISIRGIGARTPFGTNKIRAFYGNIPLTSGDSETTIEDIDVENIRSVEIIKGPLSSVYGSGLGGAILIQPKTRSTDGHSGRVSSTAGSFGLLKNTATYGFDSQNGSLNLSYHRLESDGWRKNSKYRREGVTLAGELFRGEKSKLTYFGNYTYMKAYIPSSIDKNTFEHDPQSAAATWLASKGFEQYDSWMAGLSYETKIVGSLSNATSVFYNHKKSDEPRPFDILRQNTTGYGARTQFNGRIISDKITYLFGAEWFKDGFEGRNLENLYQQNNGNGSLAGVQIAGNDQDRTIWNAFAQLRLKPSERFEIQGGLNFNKTEFDLDTTFPIDEKRSESYAYDGIWAPQLSVLFHPSGFVDKTLYVSASRGFSMPAVEETLNPDGSVNPNIKPENGYNFEFGGKFFFSKRKLYVEFAVYTMEIRDLLVAQRIGDDQYVGVNAGKTSHRGIEISGQYDWRFTKGWSLQPFVSASVGRYKFEEFVNNDVDYSDNDLTGVPKNTANGGLLLTWEKGLYWSIDFRYVDKIPMNDANTVYNDSYRLWNSKIGYRLQLSQNMSFEAYAGINNIFDEKYASMILPNATTPPNGSPRYYYPGLPVNYFGGFSLNCNL
ncbi:TonB-dependent receptor [Flavobacterium sp. MAH-1]|uniref:TonB-dependent receptor n=1 Tax=Flavobacterium agri TaxID=2743471 RepID=A0A7Y9C5U7_9FLAO|nr:TonB-dependent receptor [Flavobacterium agri]NUY80780.1 TonB-dependent receptor [Flavobacterium agri]NYA70804.1 TonB-dependent receptor [Flavobacterium agri]